ncbi:LYZ2 domain-containing protein [Burkholderia diffusa]|uniref:glycoside hydrolase family 73 protein n=1 Tax=Burkholderia diffusa TaxID=488732 RepID=UPI001CB1C475|nr:glycoside hydrolase family 73 protein [Burkholderia diffusa]CAG9252421.1 LYZ2 domain-containing protein [Burkholderia diffusa]
MVSEFFAWLMKLFTARRAHPPAPPDATADAIKPITPTAKIAESSTIPLQPTHATPEPSPMPATPAGFIAAISPAAQICMKRTGVPASVTVAQAALESSWGRRAPGFNLFGIKADASWHGKAQLQVTHEVVNGKPITITAAFRAYDDWQGSIDDHAVFLIGNARYGKAFACGSGVEFAKAIAEAGYATDPQYADKLIEIIHAHDLTALDAEAAS